MYAWLEHEVQALPGNEYLAWIAFMLAGFAALAWYAFTTFRRFRHMDATATSRIRSAAQGQVELKGLGEWLPDDQMQSPFTHSRCLWYHCTIDKRKRGKNKGWTNIRDELSTHLFRLVDDTGECIVDPEGAHVVPETSSTWYGDSPGDCHRAPPPARVRVPLGAGRYRFRERLIRPATEIYALGWFRTDYLDPHPDFVDRQAEELLRQWKLQPGKYLRRFDLDGDGKIASDEWARVRVEARRAVLARMAAEKQHHHVLSRPRDKRQPYILSALAEEALVRRKKWQAYGSALGAFLMFSVLVMMAAARASMPV